MTLAPPKLLDVIYPVRPGDNNPELQFSLRSLEANYPHAQVWIVGYKPKWVKGVEFIPGNRHALRANIYFNLLEACSHPDVGEDIVILNDDFYITEPIGEIPILFRSTLQEHLNLPRVKTRPQHWWARSLQTTLHLLQDEGFPDPLSYELHTPFLASKEATRETLERFAHCARGNPPQWRTLVGNIHKIGGTKAADGKCYRPGPIQYPFMSTDDSSFRHFREQLKELFPEPSRYER